MKKTLLSLGVISAFSGAASAQTTVTVYGIMDAGIVHESGSAAGSVTKVTGGAGSGSRLGFKGSEDLGGGLSANFRLEMGILNDTGNSAQGGRTFGRHASVGLSGGFGSVEFGRFYNVISNVLFDFDPFGLGQEGSSANILNFRSRMDNSIYYRSPVVNGFSGEMAYGFGEVAGNTAAGRDIGASVGYAQGPFAVRLAHQNMQNATGTNAFKVTNLNGSYNFGPGKFFLIYNINKDDAAIDSRDWLTGASFKAGPAGTLIVSYIRHKDKTALQRDANQAAIGYAYALSKRTDLYTSYASINNRNGATYTVGNATEIGTGNKGFAVGVRHRF